MTSAVQPPAGGSLHFSRLRAFRMGLLAPLQGFGYLWRFPRLWRYGLLPVVLNMLITATVLVALLAAAAAFAAYLHPRFPAGLGWRLVEAIAAIGLLLLALALAASFWIFLQGVLCGHFYALLAREVELALGLPPEEIREISWGYHAADAGRDVAALVLINGGFLLLHLVPVVGSIVAVAGSLYFDFLLLGEEYFDYPLALRGNRRRETKEFVRQNRFETLGLGAAVFAANFVPIIGAIPLTTAVVGAVLLHRDLQTAP